MQGVICECGLAVLRLTRVVAGAVWQVRLRCVVVGQAVVRLDAVLWLAVLAVYI